MKYGHFKGIIQFILAGLEIAWLPKIVVEPYLREGSIILLDDPLPSENLFADCFRIQQNLPTAREFIWQLLTVH